MSNFYVLSDLALNGELALQSKTTQIISAVLERTIPNLHFLKDSAFRRVSGNEVISSCILYCETSWAITLPTVL